MNAFKPLVFSGVQPTGNLHLGNYLGAIRKFVALQEDNDCIYCVVDMHAITAQLVHSDLKAQTRSIAAAFIASGIDPVKHIVFNQSAVPQHAELAWVFVPPMFLLVTTRNSIWNSPATSPRNSTSISATISARRASGSI